MQATACAFHIFIQQHLLFRIIIKLRGWNWLRRRKDRSKEKSSRILEVKSGNAFAMDTCYIFSWIVLNLRHLKYSR
ncbi:unnamed protein product [Hermetia illucens]|uniref:Uncharacterized protein n=1 Tax=Hermetia illucens TaxID=343691 RepID=A0A7R8UIF1_HERIL|nr:unnamed protein product [Hermetia illucens]